MLISDDAKASVKAQLKTKGCTPTQIKQAISWLEFELQAHSEPEKNKNEYHRDILRFKKFKNAVHEVRKCSNTINWDDLYDICELTEQRLNSCAETNKVLHPKNEFYRRVSPTELDELFDILSDEISHKQAALENLSTSELLMRKLADTWDRFSEMFNFTSKQAELILFCCNVLDMNENTIKSRLTKLGIKVGGANQD